MHKNTVTIKAISPQTQEKLEEILANVDEITLCEPRHGTLRRFFHRYRLPLEIVHAYEIVTNEKTFTLSVNQPDYKIADSVAMAMERDIIEKNGLVISNWEWTSKQAVIATPEEKIAFWRQARNRFRPDFK